MKRLLIVLGCVTVLGTGVGATLSAFSDEAVNSANSFEAAPSFGCPSTTPTPAALTGFEPGVVSAATDGRSGSVSADSAVKRTGGYSLKAAPAGSAAYADLNVSGSPGTVVTRVAVRLNSLPSANVNLVAALPAGFGGNPAVIAYNASTGKFAARFSASGTLTDGTVTAAAGTWYVIELRARFDANPRTLDWRIDSSAQPEVSSAETASSASSVRLGTSAAVSYTANYDDVMVSTTSGDYPIGDGKVHALRPDGVGTHSNPLSYLKNYPGQNNVDATSGGLLDEVPMSSESDFIYQQGVSTGSYAELTFADTTEACANAVSATLAYESYGTSGANAGTTRVMDGSAGTDVWSGNMVVPNLSYKRKVITPGSSPWTKEAVNGLKGRVGFGSDVDPVPFWHALLLEYDVRQ